MFQDILAKTVRQLKNDLASLKNNISEWIVFYNKKHASHEDRLKLLEQRIVYLERRELEKRW